jgi:hypothetical protein
MKKQTDKDTGIERIKNVYNRHLLDMTKKHSKVFQTRFDLFYPEDGSVPYNEKQIRDLTEYLHRDLARNAVLSGPNQKRGENRKGQVRHKTDPRIIVVKERHEASSRPHYHCLTLVNGNAKNNTQDIHWRAERQWANCLGLQNAKGLVDYCNKTVKPSIMINRNDKDYYEQLEAAKQQISYLAKRKGKENIPTRLWQVSGTRVPKG